MNTYSVVINNPTDQDEAALQSARSKGWRIVGQKEVGQNGTPHYQLAVTSDVDWKTMKSHFKRANIQEARDPEALETYCVKEETRVLDFAQKREGKQRPVLAQATIQFFESMFKEMYATHEDAADELIKADDTLKLYDQAVNEMILVEGYATALRATRPDVRSTYRKYRYAMWSVWWYKNAEQEDSISIPINADEHALQGNEDASDESSESAPPTEAEEEGSEGDGGASTEASDSESDCGDE